MTPLYLAAAFIAGLCLGTVYFAVLWAAVRRLVTGAPVWSHVVLALVRLALVLGPIAGALALGLPLLQLAFAGLGFLAARLAATRLVRPQRKEP
jgi:hypothetical protein